MWLFGPDRKLHPNELEFVESLKTSILSYRGEILWWEAVLGADPDTDKLHGLVNQMNKGSEVLKYLMEDYKSFFNRIGQPCRSADISHIWTTHNFQAVIVQWGILVTCLQNVTIRGLRELKSLEELVIKSEEMKEALIRDIVLVMNKNANGQEA